MAGTEAACFNRVWPLMGKVMDRHFADSSCKILCVIQFWGHVWTRFTWTCELKAKGLAVSRTSPKVWKCQIYPNMPSCKFPTNFYKHVNNPGNIANMTKNHRLFAAVVRLVSVNVWNCMGRHVNVEWGLLKKLNISKRPNREWNRSQKQKG